MAYIRDTLFQESRMRELEKNKFENKVKETSSFSSSSSGGVAG